MSEYSMQESYKESYDPDALQNLDNDFISLECLNNLGLDENPFIDHARDPFLFIDQQIEMSINVLMDYLKNQNSTLLLLGEIGIGKTTLLRVLLRKGYQEFNYCTLRAKPNTTFSEIEEKFKKRWRLTQNKIDENDTADKYVKNFIATEKNPVLIIDDAHRLSSGVIDDLLSLKHRVGLQSSKAMGLVLAAEPKIQSVLSGLEQNNPAATHVFQVNSRAFDANQCENYIKYRLGKAGFTGEDFFTDNELKNIFNQSLGLPRIINKLAREAITSKCKQSARITTPAREFKTTPGVRLGLILAGIIGLTFLAINFFNKSADQGIELDLETPPTKQEKQMPIESHVSNKVPKLDKKEVEASPQKLKHEEITKPYVAPLVLGPLHIEAEKTAQIDKKQKIEKPKIIVSEDPSQPKSQNWLLQQNPDAYTIQIVASPKQDSLIKFANQWLADVPTAYYQKSVQGKEWFVLVQGIYPNREQAQAAIQTLPSSVKENQPYPQQLKNIQKIIQP